MNSSDAATGMRLAQMGRFAEALPYLENANRVAPTDVPILHAVASLLQWASRGEDAAERYRLAAALLPQDIGVLSGWGRSLLLLGERDRAIALFGQALALDPQYADPGGLFDMLLRESGDSEAVCNLLQPLVDRHPAHVGLLGQYAKTLLTAERLQEAQAAYELYRTLRPQDPLPHVELGRMAVSRGDTALALEYFESALEASPGYAAALWEIAQINGWRIEPETLALIPQLMRSATDPKSLAGLHAMMARHCDRVGDFSAVALHAARTNALMAQIVPPQQRYHTGQHAIEIDAASGTYTPQLFHRLHDAGSQSQRPVFVIGLPRSGTTLLEQMLASHPSIVGVGEQSIAQSGLRRALAASGSSREMFTAHAVGNAAAWHLQVLEERLRRLAIERNGERIVDKHPDNYLLAGWLRIAFPNAAIIHCLRDPRDVAWSCWMTQFADVRWCYELDHIANRIEQHRRLMHHWRGTIGESLTEVRYEHLVADPETELRRVLAAIGLDWHPAVLAFADRKSANRCMRAASRAGAITRKHCNRYSRA
jgi:Flp pilus assembly protein TadD